MKATGIIRRIDDLGRVVIPKSLRQTMRIVEGDALEIFTEGDAIILRPYAVCNQEKWDIALAAVHELCGDEVALFDSDKDFACGNRAIGSTWNETEIKGTFGNLLGYLTTSSDICPMAAKVVSAILEA